MEENTPEWAKDLQVSINNIQVSITRLENTIERSSNNIKIIKEDISNKLDKYTK